MIYVAGHNGMVGSAFVRMLEKDNELLLRTRGELDLTDPAAVDSLFKENKIDEVWLAAAKVGGIMANSSKPVEFLMDNLKMEMNIIESAHRSGVGKLLFLGSSCVYPKMAAQPIFESDLSSGKLETTNESYAIAKITGIKICEAYNRQYGTDYRSVMPCNLYGQNDNFDVYEGHVLPAMMNKTHKAKINKTHLTLWGTGWAMREFLHVDDLAEACSIVMRIPKSEYDALTSPHQSHINIGSGFELSIRALSVLMSEVVGYDGLIRFDSGKPDGTPRKILNGTIMSKLGWKPKTDLRDGLIKTYEWFLKHAP